MTRPLKAWTDLRALPRAVWWLVAASFVNRLGAMALPFLTLYLVSSARLSAGAAGGVLSLYGAVALVAGPIAGRLCDRLGASRILVVALAASGALLCLYPLARSLPTLIMATVGWSFAAETFRPASTAHLAAIAPPAQRKQAFALLRLAINLGMSVGPAAAGFLAQRSYAAIFVVDGGTSLVAAATLALAASKEPAPSAPQTTSPSRFPLSALADPRLALALCGLFPLAVLFFQNEASIPLLLVEHRHLSPAFFGAMFTLNTVIIVFTEIPLNAALGQWSHRRSLTVGACFGAVGFAGMALARGPIELALAVVLWTIGEMLYSPAIMAYVADVAPSERRGEYLSMYTTTFALAFVAAPYVGIGALERLGPGGLAAAMVALGGISALLFTRLERGAPTAVGEVAP
jgi:MFS family permease